MESTTPTQSAPHIVELDALRGIAAMAVLCCHLPRGFWFGATGVDLFFVLSGFLITGIIQRNHDQPRFLRAFYWRRSLRILPLYYLVILMAYAVNLLRATPADTSGFGYYLVYLQNIHQYWGGETPPVDLALGHTWTLAIEEQFYLFWPVALLLLRGRAKWWLAGLFVVLPILLRGQGLPKTVLLGHTDSLAMGAFLAWIMIRTESVKRERQAVCYASIALASFLAYGAMYWQMCRQNPAFTGGEYLQLTLPVAVISLAYFGVIGLFVCMTGSRPLALFRNRYLVQLGTISYGLYLYHLVLYENLDTLVKFRWKLGDPWWLDVTKVIVSLAVAALSWRFFEQPILRFKDRFRYNDASVVASQPVPSLATAGAPAHE
ncbi:acyltransferase [Stieleria sp. ICT_E10.1]|uniref:acyltransferase family protein n=1 Tax=Stieleria sedimenti TaxID=2976331 RepID=UPI00218075FD|nr:acyltransferase [Stieleria sedimenti]MCS7466976.1 acyltransferase [Stieleria sedimenti]